MSAAEEARRAIPTLGSGLGYRRELHDATLAARNEIDFVEIVTEQFMHAPDLSGLEELLEHFPVVPHGVGLSIGSAGPANEEYLTQVKRITDATGTPYYSEHLAVTRAPGIDIGHLSPVWLTKQVLGVVIDNVNAVQDRLGKPLVLENISYLLEIPHATMAESEFFHRLVEATGCGLLLDLTNVYINSENHHFDPLAYLDSMPLDAVVQVHLAGGYWDDGVFIDAHSEPVHEETWALLEALADRTAVRASIVEQDANFPDELTPLLNDVARSRRTIAAGRASHPLAERAP